MGRRGWVVLIPIFVALGMINVIVVGTTIYMFLLSNLSVDKSSEVIVNCKRDNVDAGLETMDSQTKKRNMILSSAYVHPCEADHLLAKSLKNKMDYATKHGMSIVYNLAHVDPNFAGGWSKQTMLKKLFPAHPEVEWFLWMDSDAYITDMSWDIPYEKYEGYNMVVPGWSCAHDRIRPNWTCINAGIFLLRRCDWSLHLLDTWLDWGREVNAEKYSKLISEEMAGRDGLPPEDQSSLFYLIRREPERFGKHIYIEEGRALSAYWLDYIDKYDEYLTNADSAYRWAESHRPPFVTHFSGCNVCGLGTYAVQHHQHCFKHMEQAFNFGDNQVIVNYGLRHVNLSSPVLEMIPG